MTFQEFQNYYCNKFQRNNPLPWQDGMQSIIWWITNGLPENTKAYVTITNNPTGVSVTGEGIDNNPYVWTFNFNAQDVRGDFENYNFISVEPTNEQGSVVVTQLDGEYKIEFDATIKVERQDGTFANVPTTVTLPIKAGEGITIDATEDGTFAEIKGGGGGKSYLHTITFGGQTTPNNSTLRIKSVRSEEYPGFGILATDILAGRAEQFGFVESLAGQYNGILFCIGSSMIYVKSLRGSLGASDVVEVYGATASELIYSDQVTEI